MTATQNRPAPRPTEFSRLSGRHRFTVASVAGTPDEPGVFWLFRTGTMIFVGLARRSLHARLLAHLRGKEVACAQRADEYQWETSSTPTARARTLLEEYMVRTGRLPRCNDRLP